MEVNFISAKFEPATRLTIDADIKVIRRYLKEGYTKRHMKGGYCDLEKPSKALVKLELGDTIKEINMRSGICEYYEQMHLTSELVERFAADAKEGKFKLEWDPARSYCFIVKA